MESIFEVLFSLVAELLFEIVGQVLVELGLHALLAPFERSPHPVAAIGGYVLLGGALGGLSLWIRPNPLIHDPVLAIGYLVVSPIVAGLVMVGIGSLRRRRHQPLIRLDQFGYGALFAFTYGFVRWTFAG